MNEDPDEAVKALAQQHPWYTGNWQTTQVDDVALVHALAALEARVRALEERLASAE